MIDCRIAGTSRIGILIDLFLVAINCQELIAKQNTLTLYKKYCGHTTQASVSSNFGVM